MYLLIHLGRRSYVSAVLMTCSPTPKCADIFISVSCSMTVVTASYIAQLAVQLAGLLTVGGLHCLLWSELFRHWASWLACYLRHHL